jgi:23S rRNA (cytosine1962-C5)-methyltransferase
MLLEYFKLNWDYELIDSGEGYRLERWGNIFLSRPDPQIIWPKSLPDSEWEKAAAKFIAGKGEDKGKWDIKNKIPNPWTVTYKNTKFLLKLSPFKHTGLFAEQAGQWEWMLEKLKVQNEKIKILNLFAYTGGATMVLAKAGCQVTHVDASKPSLTWANENHKLNNLPTDSVRWILDDCVKFVKREVKRGVKYDGIIMDPPAFGHSPDGKTWKFNQDLPGLLTDCVKLLSNNASFLVINGYATNSSALAINNLLEDAAKNIGGKTDFGELCLKQKNSRLISTGIFARWKN